MNRQMTKERSEPATPGGEDARHRLGARARTLRKQLGLTLQAVADRGGLAVSTISKIERGMMAPTYDVFSRLAAGLDVDIATLFEAAGNPFAAGGLAISRREEFGYHETENYTYEMLFPQLRGKSMVPMLGTLKPLEKMRFERMVKHEGEEFLFVLEGRVIVQFEDHLPVILEAGESIYFDSRRGHLYASAERDEARILCVCTKLAPAPQNG